MAEGISLPPGAFAAAKSGQPQPAPVAPKADATAPAVPETKLRKAPEAKKEPEIVKKQAPQLRNEDAETSEGDEPKGMTAAEKKIWKLKVDGEEFDFDATDEEAVKREIMKARGAAKRFESAAQMRKEAEQIVSMLKDPASLREILQDPRIGVDLKKFAEDYVWEQIQESQLTPEQKAQRDKDRRLAEYEAREAKAREEGVTRQQQEAQTRYEVGYEKKIMTALEAGGIPKSPKAIARMADYLYQAVEHGYDLSPEDLVQQVRQDYIADFTSVLGDADGDQLLALLGEANAEKLRKADLKRLKNPQGNPFPTRSAAKTAASGKAPPAQQRKTGTEWRSDLMKDFLNRKR